MRITNILKKMYIIYNVFFFILKVKFTLILKCENIFKTAKNIVLWCNIAICKDVQIQESW